MIIRENPPEKQYMEAGGNCRCAAFAVVIAQGEPNNCFSSKDNGYLLFC